MLRLIRQIAAAALLVFGMPIVALAAPGTQGEITQVLITSPQTGDTVSGVVTIIGSVSSPGFRSYSLEVAPDPSLSDRPWAPVQGAVGQQVQDGVLGVWDTTELTDGRYILRLRMARNEDVPVDFEVRLLVANSTPTPLPPASPTLEPQAIGSATVGPSPTSLIEQPPTRTPRPTATPGGPTATPDPLSPEQSPLGRRRLQRAATVGFLVALAGFLLLGIHTLSRARSRGEVDPLWEAFERRVLTPLREWINRHRS